MAKKSGKSKVKKTRLTIRQARLVKIFAAAKVRSAAEAAILAGYSPKFARTSAYQALQAIKQKTPDILDRHGMTIEAFIYNHLRPMLGAKETKIIQHEGEVTDMIEVADNGSRLKAIDMGLKLHGAFPTEQEKQQGSMGVEVIVVDIPRPDRSGVGVKVTASVPASARKVERATHEDDPRPRD